MRLNWTSSATQLNKTKILIFTVINNKNIKWNNCKQFNTISENEKNACAIYKQKWHLIEPH